jgi:hypothetical protein
VDLRERHAKFIFEAPEACEKDSAREEIILPVWTLLKSLARWIAVMAAIADVVTYLDHDCEIVLHESCTNLHWILFMNI